MAKNQDDDEGNDSQRNARDAAQGFDLPPVELRIVEQMLRPSIEQQHCQQDDDDDDSVQQEFVRQDQSLRAATRAAHWP